jgi:hypothetical protein
MWGISQLEIAVLSTRQMISLPFPSCTEKEVGKPMIYSDGRGTTSAQLILSRWSAHVT